MDVGVVSSSVAGSVAGKGLHQLAIIDSLVRVCIYSGMNGSFTMVVKVGVELARCIVQGSPHARHPVQV